MLRWIIHKFFYGNAEPFEKDDFRKKFKQEYIDKDSPIISVKNCERRLINLARAVKLLDHENDVKNWRYEEKLNKEEFWNVLDGMNGCSDLMPNVFEIRKKLRAQNWEKKSLRHYVQTYETLNEWSEYDISIERSFNSILKDYESLDDKYEENLMERLSRSYWNTAVCYALSSLIRGGEHVHSEIINKNALVNRYYGDISCVLTDILESSESGSIEELSEVLVKIKQLHNLNFISIYRNRHKYDLHVWQRIEFTHGRMIQNVLLEVHEAVSLWYKHREELVRQNAARIIQKGLHNWLWSPRCKDGTVGIVPRLGWKHCQELIATTSQE